MPPAGPLLIAFLGALLLSRRPRLGKTLLWTGLLSLLLLSMPFTAHWLHGRLAYSAPLDFTEAAKAQAIVIAGGGTRSNALEYGSDGDTLAPLTLERVRYAAWVAKRTKLPVLTAGGVVFDNTAEADLMRGVLQDEFGVPVRWVENGSRTTHENGLNSAAMLHPEGIKTILLVTHAYHMPRARAEFEAAGFEVIPAPTVLHNANAEPDFRWFLPSVSALRTSAYVVHETLGDLARRLGL
jgi:uncharacterized SAM-binding protein YcdF (DUF218 family)